MRALGAKTAQKYEAPRTAEMIKSGECYEVIFRIARDEIGVPRLVLAVVDMKDAWVAKEALQRVEGLTNEHRGALLDVTINTRNSYVACSLRWSFNSGLTPAQWARFGKAFDIPERPFAGR